VLDPARLREDLAKLLLRDGGWPEFGVEGDGARRRRALIDDENVILHRPLVCTARWPIILEYAAGGARAD
jgi:hypothetical protein